MKAEHPQKEESKPPTENTETHPWMLDMKCSRFSASWSSSCSRIFTDRRAPLMFANDDEHTLKVALMSSYFPTFRPAYVFGGEIWQPADPTTKKKSQCDSLQMSSLAKLSSCNIFLFRFLIIIIFCTFSKSTVCLLIKFCRVHHLQNCPFLPVAKFDLVLFVDNHHTTYLTKLNKKTDQCLF